MFQLCLHLKLQHNTEYIILTSHVRVQGGGLDEGLGQVDEEASLATALVLEGPGVGAEHRMTGSQEDVWSRGRTGVCSLSLSTPGAQAEVPAERNLHSEMSEMGSLVELAAVVRGSRQQFLTKMELEQ